MNRTQEAKEKLKNRYNTFILPICGIEVSYRKPNPIESALQKRYPTFLSELIVSEMKDAFKGKSSGNSEKLLEEREFTDGDVADFVAKGYILLKDLAIEPHFGDVEDDDTIRVRDIPERDAIEFLQQVIKDSKTEIADGGGEISEESLKNFPDSKRVSKRNSAR